MNILIIGSGGREHAITAAVARSPKVSRLYVAPGNAGTLELATNVAIEADDLESLVAFARCEAIDLTIVGPEGPLAAGIVDRFREEGLPIFGPTQAGAKLESSKAWAKSFMQRYGIVTAPFAIADDPETARQWVKAMWRPEGVVLKADGLAAGKGVVVASSLDEAMATIDTFMVQRTLGKAGSRLVIEEVLKGEELTLLAFIDGKSWYVMPLAQDHKRLLDGDQGPNTGGMGAYTPVLQISKEMRHRLEHEILQPLVRGLDAEGIEYRGVVFVGLMNTWDGPRVLEFNCRFGDPETQVILPGMTTDFVEAVEACMQGRLGDVTIRFDKRCRVGVVAATPGYPGPVTTGDPIRGLDEVHLVPGVQLYHAGTVLLDDEATLVTNGGRVLNIVAEGDTVEEARARAYEAITTIRFGDQRPHYRSDIGGKAVVLERGTL